MLKTYKAIKSKIKECPQGREVYRRHIRHRYRGLTKKSAEIFGSYRNSSYLCSVKMNHLTTPLNAGSKTVSPLLHLKAT